MNGSTLTRAAHSRSFGIVIAVLSLIAVCFIYTLEPEKLPAYDNGLGLPSAGNWVSPGIPNLMAALAGTVATVVLMMLLNKVHNVMRSMTSLFIAFFCLMQLATPELMTHFYTGTMLAVVVPLCIFLTFGCYRNPGATRTVFLISLLLSAFASTQYCYLLYIPAMFIGFAQMGIFNRRTLSAAMMGMFTPWIILFGFGIINPAEIVLPEFASIFGAIDSNEAYLLLFTVALTALLTIACYIFMFMRTIAYNARARAINGMFLIVSLTTIVAACVDFRNMISYIPLLNFCAAMEVAHFFSVHKAEKSFIAIYTILAVYAALSVCQIII